MLNIFLLFSLLTFSLADEVWIKSIAKTGKRPNCPFVKINKDGANYQWAKLDKCKELCINEATGKCNMVSRFGETYKQSTDLYHCRFYTCQDPFDFQWIDQTQWGNGAGTSNTYMMPIRHYLSGSDCINFINKTRWKNETIWINKTRLIDKYIDKIRLVDKYVNKTRFVDKIRWNNKTRLVDKYVNKTRLAEPTAKSIRSPALRSTRGPIFLSRKTPKQLKPTCAATIRVREFLTMFFKATYRKTATTPSNCSTRASLSRRLETLTQMALVRIGSTWMRGRTRITHPQETSTRTTGLLVNQTAQTVRRVVAHQSAPTLNRHY
jgi:hypothetical protein